MEDNGKGLFYGVIGVATLIVAIIGATFAYFNASKEASNITGQANNTLQSDLTLKVSKVKWNLAGETVASENLVPADFEKEANALTETEVNAALGKKCIDGGFTGCHVWKIEASSNQDLTAANINLNLKVNGQEATEDSKYSYVVFTGSETPNGEETEITSLTATVVSDKGTFNTISGLGSQIYTGALNSTGKTYYVMIYYKNEEQDQNSEVTEGKGNYTGTVTLNAAGAGQVTADFTQE